MNRAVLAAAVVLAATAAAAGGEDAQVAADRLQKRYENTRTLVAKFRQEVQSPVLERTTRARGKVYYERPGRMRWEFATPEPQIIVADGKTLWIYQPGQNQVLRAPFSEAFEARTPVSFLTGVGRLREDFRVRLVATKRDRWVLELVPRRPDMGGVSLTLEVARDTGDVVRAEVRDSVGTVTRWEFSELRRNVELDPALFHFSPPLGTDVVRPLSPGPPPAAPSQGAPVPRRTR